MSSRLLGRVSCYVSAYLIGEYFGDYGWEGAWLGLAADAKTFERLRKAKALHERWAIFGTIRCLTRELLQKYTAIDYGARKSGSWLLP